MTLRAIDARKKLPRMRKGDLLELTTDPYTKRPSYAVILTDYNSDGEQGVDLVLNNRIYRLCQKWMDTESWIVILYALDQPMDRPIKTTYYELGDIYPLQPESTLVNTHASTI